MTTQQRTELNMAKFIQPQSLLLLEKLNELKISILMIHARKAHWCDFGTFYGWYFEGQEVKSP